MTKSSISDSDRFTITFENTFCSRSGVYLTAQVRQRLLSLDVELSTVTVINGQTPLPTTLSRDEEEILGRAIVILRRKFRKTGEV